ncbi:uncharacterized protein K452DRAFT_260764 [Aplosporella prunicola CBS 121167]|uniref:Ring-like domain-containing protein n=1 Tax=Aplosporella prunicola CBS 121167 TaxID=1176127 RepID=A0A6A6AX62_9PEZI|nr:uncharacterized protein K452DRAFT_260764 [Aplosporella prunicola CBS 121167]KAF2135377.1 hypothetical protein K452DRAFT_260764 [Aplosporella prunicola CBS 121167]
MLEYFTYKKFKNNRDKKKAAQVDATPPKSPILNSAATPKSPILNDEDEAFLERITSEEAPPPLPKRPDVTPNNGQRTKSKDAQTALMDGADQIPLPTSPPATPGDAQALEEKNNKKRVGYWSFVTDIPKRAKSKRQTQAATDLAAAAETVKKGESAIPKVAVTTNEGEVQKEEQDLTAVLDQLNLAAVNNRVFSFSKESQELLEKFKQVLKDLVNGAPHAYDDLEKLLKNSDDQLSKMYGSLPPFLQNLVKQLPTKMTAALAPELLAATAEKPGFDASHLNEGDARGGDKKKKKKSNWTRVPPLKKLVSEQGAVAAMLRSILNFLKLRFPALVSGTNVLMSLAVFLLLFVFWYCHKRGREVRLAKEAEAHSAASSQSNLNKSASSSDVDETILTPGARNARSTEPPITIHESPATEDYSGATVRDLPSVLDLPDPKTVPLPKEK